MLSWVKQWFRSPAQKELYEGELIAGQVWCYYTKDQSNDRSVSDKGPKLHIFMEDNDPELGKIFHIRVEGLSLHKKDTEKPVTVFPHAPISEKSLRESVTRLMGENQNVPDASVKAYLTWNANRQAGDSVIFTLPVDEIVAQISQALNS